jgi:glutaredoxin 3
VVKGNKGMLRPIILAAVLLLVFLSPVPSALSAELYQWKDKDGKIFFSDSPLPYEADVEIRKLRESPAATPERREGVPRPKTNISEEKRSYGNINVIMYITPTCPYCRKAGEYIHSLNVNLTEYNVEKDRSKREEMLIKSGGSKGVPVIDVEGIIIKGYGPQAIKAAVEKRRSL